MSASRSLAVTTWEGSIVDTAADVHASRSVRPRLVVSVTASVDGRVTLNRASRLLDEAAGHLWHSIHPASADAMFGARHAEIERRYAPEVVLEGSGTFVADTDGPIADLPAPSGDAAGLFEDFLPRETDCRWFAVVDGRGRIRWTHKRDASRRLLVVIASRTTPAPYLAHLRREDIPYIVAGDGPVDLGDALRTMKDQLGVTCVVSEAGGGLNGALLRSGLVDELHLMLLPALVGGLGTPTSFDGAPLQLGKLPTRLRLLDTRVTTDGIISLHYEIDRQPAFGRLTARPRPLRRRGVAGGPARGEPRARSAFAAHRSGAALVEVWHNDATHLLRCASWLPCTSSVAPQPRQAGLRRVLSAARPHRRRLRRLRPGHLC